MPESKGDTPRFSDEMIGETDLARVDAHVIQPEEYDELPELTDEMMERAVRMVGGKPISKAGDLRGLDQGANPEGYRDRSDHS